MSSPQIIEYCASDGVRASFRLFPSADPDAPVVICLPAMGVQGRYYSNFACLLSKSGFHVLTSDLRGIDSSSVRASRHCDFGYEEIISRDLPALVEFYDLDAVWSAESQERRRQMRAKAQRAKPG